MATLNKTTLTIETSVDAPVEKVWQYWTQPEHIKKWNTPSEDWHTTRAENDLRVGGTFLSRMEAKDGSFGFDFAGKYTKVVQNKTIAYVLEDERKVEVHFASKDNSTHIRSTFQAETINSLEMQQAGWQAILDNFKKYTEENHTNKF